MQTVNRTDGKITDLQVLRGISILLVLFCHLSLTSNLLALSPIKPVVSLYLGVEIFFVISGYVVTLSLFKDGLNGPRFFARRIFRLIPAMLLFILFSCALHALVRRADLPVAMKELFTIPTGDFLKQEVSVLFGFFLLRDGPVSYMNGAMWSLSVEDQFYAAVTLVMLLAAVVARKSGRAARWCLLGVAGAFCLTLGACRLGLLVWGMKLTVALPAFLNYLLRGKFDFLALGVVLAFLKGRLPERFRTFSRDCGTFVAPSLILIPLGLVALCAPTPSDPRCERSLAGFALPVTALCFGLLVLLAADNKAFPASRGPLYRFMVYLGDRSYTLYLFHFPVFVVAWLVTNRYAPWAFSDPIIYGLSQFVLVTLLLLPLVEVIYRLVELPLMRLGKRLTHSARSVAVETDAVILPMVAAAPTGGAQKIAS